MKAKKIRNYRSKNTGKPVFVYAVTGTAEEMKTYKEAQGTFYREDDTTGEALYFTTNFMGPQGNLIITSKGKIAQDMSKFDEAQSLVEQYGGNFGNVLAQSVVASITGNAPAAQPVEAPAAENSEVKEPAGEESKNPDEL